MTVTATAPLLPSLVAVIVAQPTASAVTTPAEVTEAVSESELDHVSGASGNVFPLPSLATAISCTVPATGRLAHPGVTDTDATRVVATGVSQAAATTQATTRDDVCVKVTAQSPGLRQPFTIPEGGHVPVTAAATTTQPALDAVTRVTERSGAVQYGPADLGVFPPASVLIAPR